MRTIIFILCLGFVHQEGAQTLDQSSTELTSKEGQLYFYWGWNRARYSPSDISFHGDGYDFTLHDVVAHDRQTPFDLFYYLNPKKMTIPQYQYRLGYYLTDKTSISWGFNHMKYVVDTDQEIKIDGSIQTPEAVTYNGTYVDDDIVLEEDFLMFEHTDGLNYLSINVDRTELLWSTIDQKVGLNVIGGGGLGAMFPRSNVILFNQSLDKWHIAGYGISTHVALRLDFLKHFFIQGQLETGFINMPDILTTGIEEARAKQHFFYLEQLFQFGGYYRLIRKDR